ncbi:MAG: glycosyltransferase [Candidatus Omnitrophica bacterium]|nr:glycosyltransferase [Candidatus Omnitrophota bacterium]MBD3269575.1 glycosyltransferase [Candidatus Omnitrophota bacterium]
MESIKDAKFKTAIVSTHDCVNPSWGGGGLRTRKISLELVQRGINVYLVAPLEEKVLADKITNLHISPPSKKYSSLLSTLRFNLQMFIKLSGLMKRTDLVVIHNCIAALSIPLLKKFFPVRFVLDITDIHTKYIYMENKVLFNRIAAPFLEKVEYSIIKTADLVIAVSSAMKELLISKGVKEEIIKVIPDGVELKKIPSCKEEGAEMRVLHLGAVDIQHNVEVVLEAVSSVLRILPEVEFLFVGGGRGLEYVRKKSIELGVESNCIFTGKLPQEKAREYLQSSLIGIIPRRSCPANDLVTTVKIFEYWASGTAVISSPLKAIQEIAHDRINILFFDGSSEDLAEKIIFLLQNRDFRRTLIGNGERAAANFDLDKSAKNIVDFALD